MDPLSSLTITPALLRLIAGLDEFKGRWHALGRLAPDRLSALRRVATIESVGSSTRIEGAKLSDAEVDRLLSRIEVRSFRSRDEQEVAGYAAAMELVFESWRELTLTENHVKQLHDLLLRHSTRDQRQMEGLVGWTRQALEAGELHPLLVIGAFTVRFLAIHPFQDGNGRLSRVLTTLLLLRAGYEYAPFSSLERVIEENKDEYYRTLRRAQSTLDKGEKRLGEWLAFFLRCLSQQMHLLERKVDREQLMAALSALDESLLRLAKEHGRLTVASAVKLTDANRNTVKLHLRQLTEAGRLRLLGAGRGAWYEIG